MTARQPTALVSCRGGDGGEGGAPPVQLFAKILTGKTVSIEVEAGEAIEDIKAWIVEKEGIPPEQQRLFSGGQQLQDGKTIDDYDLRIGRGTRNGLLLVFHLVSPFVEVIFYGRKHFLQALRVVLLSLAGFFRIEQLRLKFGKATEAACRCP